jgi:hypothetical protein
MGRATWATPCLLALTMAGCGGLTTGPIAAPSSSPAGSPAPVVPMMPSPETVGGEARLPVTFPDGTTARLSYPVHLDLAEMGVQPDVDLAWNGRWVGSIVFSHGGPEPRILAGPDPVMTHERDGVLIEQWEVQRRGGRHQDTDAWLVYELASWTVHVPVSARDDPVDILDGIRPHETDDGFAVVDVAEPAELAQGYGEAGGPQLAFGDLDPLPDFVRPNEDGLLINVAPSECRGFHPTVQLEGSYASACLEDVLFVNGTSFSGSKESQRKLAEIVEGLRLVELEAAR